MKMSSRIEATISFDALENNFGIVKRLIPQTCKVLGVVKADAYGHGAVKISKKLIDIGVDFLGVATANEGLELRRSGISLPILILGITPESMLPLVINNELTQTIHTLDYAVCISKLAEINKNKLKTHIKVDTGMSRLGFSCQNNQMSKQTIAEIEQINRLPYLKIEGIYTHFSSAGMPGCEYTKMQIERFDFLISELDKLNIPILIKHASASSGIISFPEAHYDMVRTGIMLYGYQPSEECGKDLGLIPVMELKASVVQVKEMDIGAKISYGMTWEAAKRAKIAVISAGYADGINRGLSNKGFVLINNIRCPIIGRVCMDLLMCDITDVPNNQPISEAIIFGREKAAMNCDTVAEICNTISYEVLCGIGKRVPRTYL